MQQTRWLAPARVVKAVLNAALPPDAAEEVVERLELDLDAPEDQHVGIVGPRTFWGEIRRASGDPLVGIRAAEKMNPDVFGRFLELLQSCADLRSAIEVVCSYLSLIDAAHRATLRVDGDTAIFDWHMVSGASRGEDVDFCSVLIWRLAKSLLPSLELTELHFPHEPAGGVSGSLPAVLWLPGDLR